MKSDEWSIIANVFAGDRTYGETAKQLDAFEIIGAGSGRSKYRIIADVIRKLEWNNRTPFAHCSTGGSDYAVGFLKKSPLQENMSVGAAKAVYTGRLDLEDRKAGHDTMTELLNKAKASRTKEVLWRGGIHTYFPSKGVDLEEEYGNPLLLFTGPKYRYNVLEDGRVVVSLDVATKYVDSRPYLQHIRAEGLEKLEREIKRTRMEMKRLGKSFRGIHFFYELIPMDVAIDGIDERSISEIPLNDTQSIADFLTKKYGNRRSDDWLDSDQPGLRSGRLTYAPQFLYKNVPFQSVPSKITADHTFFTDNAKPRNRDPEHTAKMRWEKTMDMFDEYNFAELTIGPHSIEFSSPLEFDSSNRLLLPLLVAGSGKPVRPSKIRSELRKGMYHETAINRTYIYYSGPRNLANSFYKSMIAYAKNNFGFRLPKKPVFLEPDMKKMETQLQKSLALNPKNAIVVAIINRKRQDAHDRITNICGNLDVPSKCITERMMTTVVKRKKSYPLAGFISSLLTRARCTPWVLDSKLSYDCYMATDVGRAKSENWVMMIVYDKTGKYRIGQTEMTVGESIGKEDFTKCIEEAQSLVPNLDSLVYLRDGSIYDQERNDFKSVIENSDIRHSAMLAIRESTPFRIYRGSLSDIWRPHSGDYYILDQSNMVLCAAGADEYEHGTPSPITVDYIPIIGLIEKQKALQDVFKLSYLNWASPGRSYSMPAPLKMAHRIARELSLGLERSTVPF